MKSTGAPNWHSLWFARIAAQYGRDARFVLSRYPETYGRSVRDNLRRFFYPADQSDPFIALPPDHPMRPILRMWDLRPDVATNTEVRYVAPSPFAVIAVPASILFGLAFVGRRIRRRTSERHAAAANRVNAVVVAFMVLSILYVAAVAILLSSGDQSRYRFESMPLVCTLLAMLAPAAWRSSRLAVARVHLRPRRS